MDLEMICFEIISNVGEAKSYYIQSIQEAKKGDFQQAKSLVEKGDESFKLGHHAHSKLIQMDASGENIQFSLILTHAEDQLMAADSFKILALEFIQLYERISHE